MRRSFQLIITGTKVNKFINVLMGLYLANDLYIYFWSKNFSRSAYEKSEAKMAAIDVQ
jgi:hypothetical protein